MPDEYIRGYVAALRDYAWWKDGVQYVGSCGTTLAEAIARGTKFGETESTGKPEAKDSGVTLP